MTSLLDRLLNPLGPQQSHGERLLAPSLWSPQDLPNDVVRVIILKDFNGKKRSCLYDSKWNEGGHDDKSCNDGSAQRKRRSAGDIRLISEMSFGSIPMHHENVTTKVHEIRNPRQILLTKLFQHTRRETCFNEDRRVSSTPSIPGSAVGSRSSRSSSVMSPNMSWSLSSSMSTNTMNGDGHEGAVHLHPDSFSERCKRRSKETSIEYGNGFRRRTASVLDVALEGGAGGVELGKEAGSLPKTEDAPTAPRPRRCHYGVLCICVLISLECGNTQTVNKALEEMIFTHFVLLDRWILRLQKSLLKALKKIATEVARVSRDGSQCPNIEVQPPPVPRASRLEDSSKFVKAIGLLKAEFRALYLVPRIQGLWSRNVFGHPSFMNVFISIW